jgi:glucose-1-phosphate adenylyltransferase
MGSERPFRAAAPPRFARALRPDDDALTSARCAGFDQDREGMESTLTLVLAGGRGERLLPLTERRAKPVMPFAGRRLIDFTLENCQRSALRDVVVLTQHLAETVHEHLDAVWEPVLPRLRTLSSRDAGRHFRGTADAVRAALARFPEGRRVLVLAADHVYKMSYRDLMTDHRAQRAEATISVVPVRREHAHTLGCASIDAEGLVRSFVEKPRNPPAMPGHPRHALGSMGIYMFARHTLEEILYEYPEATDFAQHVIPGLLLGGHRVATHYFADDAGPRYWRDVGDPETYHAAHMDLLCGTFDDGDSWVGPRSLVAGGTLDRCVLGRDVQVGPGTEIFESILLDGALVGRGAHLRRVIVEEGVRIPDDARIGSDETITVVTKSVAAKASTSAA